MEHYRSYTDPQDENDVTNKRYVDKNVHNIDKKIDDQIEKVENDIDDRFKKSLGNIIVDSIKNKNIFNVDLALLFYRELCNARIIEDGIRLISNSDTTNHVYAIYRTIDLRGLEGKQLVLSYKTRSNKSVTSSLGGIELFYENAAGNDRTLIEWNATNGFSFQVKDNLGNNYYLAMTFFANRSGNQIYNNEYVDYYDIQIEKGDVPTTFVPYKKFGYNSQESMGSIVVDDISCKNLFDINGPYTSELGSPTISGNSITVPNSADNSGYTKFSQKIEVNGSLTLSCTISDGSGYARPLLMPLDSSGNVITDLTIEGYSYNQFYGGYWKDCADGKYSLTLNFPENVKYLQLGFVHNAATFTDVQIEKGNTATNYSEYKGIGYVDTGWHDIAFKNTYSNYDTSLYDAFQYRKINNQVFLRGMIKNTSVPTYVDQSIAGTLPEGVRPKNNIYFLGDEVHKPVECSITPSGDIRLFNTVVDKWVSITGINFFVD